MLDEIQHLKRRISDLEDVELELMESLEQATADRDQIVAARSGGETELRALLAARDEQLAVLDADLAERPASGRVAAELPGDLLDLYDRIRSRGAWAPPRWSAGAAPAASSRRPPPT